MTNIIQPYTYQMQSTVAPWSLTKTVGFLLIACGSLLLVKSLFAPSGNVIAAPAAILLLGTMLTKAPSSARVQ